MLGRKLEAAKSTTQKLYLVQAEHMYGPHNESVGVLCRAHIVWSKLPMLEDALERDRLSHCFQFIQGRYKNCHDQKPVGLEKTANGNP